MPGAVDFDLEKMFAELDGGIKANPNFHRQVKKALLENFNITRDTITDDISAVFKKKKEEKDPFENIDNITSIEIADYLTAAVHPCLFVEKTE